MAKLLNKFSKEDINPLIGAAGVSAVPMAARVVNKVGLQANPQNFVDACDGTKRCRCIGISGCRWYLASTCRLVITENGMINQFTKSRLTSVNKMVYSQRDAFASLFVFLQGMVYGTQTDRYH